MTAPWARLTPKAAMVAFLPLAVLCSSTVLAKSKVRETAIVHATVIDVSLGGRSAKDVADATILIRDEHIVSVRQKGRVPKGVTVIDAKGGFVAPGLIDGFGELRSQRHADAYLFDGVTSVAVPIGDGGEKIASLGRSPRILPLAMIDGAAGNPAIVRTAAQLAAQVQAAKLAGARALLIGLDISPDQLRAVHQAAQRISLTLLGEMAATSYPDAVKDGVRVFVRNDRYLTALAPAGVFAAYGRAPETPAGAAGAFRAVCKTDPASPDVTAFGNFAAQSGVALMPSLAIEATADDVGAGNPWASSAAAFLEPSDLDDPVDPETGKRPYLEQHPLARQALQACAMRRRALDAALQRAGVLYLAGSGAPSYGVMPGGGLHLELKLLERNGLSPREALAAGTANTADALGWSDRGSVLAGRLADLLILGSDPRLGTSALDDIQCVILGGRVIEREDLARFVLRPIRRSR